MINHQLIHCNHQLTITSCTTLNSMASWSGALNVAGMLQAMLFEAVLAVFAVSLADAAGGWRIGMAGRPAAVVQSSFGKG